MIYQVKTSGLKKERQNTDNSSILRIYNVGDYPVKIRVGESSFYDPIIRNQHIDITRTATAVEFEAIGGDTAVRTYRVYGDNIDECDIDGILDYDNVTITDEYGEGKFVQLKNIAQNLNSPDQGTIPSTKAVYDSIEEGLEKMGSVLVYRGSVKTFNDLPENALLGDTYNVEERHDIYGPGTNYAWNGSEWDALGSAALDVQAEENFKALVSQYTSDFENVVADATIAVNSLVSNAERFSDSAYANAQDAYVYRGESEYFATKAESKAQEASDIKDQVEDALSKAEEIVDPERFRHSIAELQLSKSNKGALHFNGGYVKGNSTAFKGIYSCLTVLQTVKIDSIDLSDNYPDRLFSLGLADIEVYNDDLSIGFNSNQVIISVAYSTAKHSDISSRLAVYKYNTKAFNMLNDGKYHTIAVVFQTGDYLKFYIDGNFVYQTDAITPYDLNLSTNAYGYGVGGRPHSSSIQAFKYGEISRSMVFNFDITSEDAPYTIEDYQQGKPIPPTLTQGIGFSIDDNFGAGGWTDGATSSGNWYKGSYVRYIANHTIDNIDTEAGITEAVDLSTSQTVGATLADVCLYNKSFSFKSHTGKRVKIKGSCKVRPLIDLGTNNAPVVSFGIARKSWSGYVQLNELPYNQWSTIEFDDYIDVPTTDAVYFGIGAKYDSTTEPVVAIADLDIKVVETLLALEDYTFNGEVLDYSGNNNHATITGNIKGDNDAKVETLYQKIAARISNNS